MYYMRSVVELGPSKLLPFARWFIAFLPLLASPDRGNSCPPCFKNSLLQQVLGRMFHVIIREGADEEVRVVVAILIPHLDALPAAFGDLLQVLRQQLALLVKVIAGADVDQGVDIAVVLLQQLASVVLAPLALVLAKVPVEGLLAPGTVDRVADRGEC